MQNIKNLIAAGKNKDALTLLQTQVKGDDENIVILLLGEFNNYYENQLRSTEAANPTLLNNIMWRALRLCDKYENPAKLQTFAEPSILDNLPLDKEGYLLGRKAALEELHATLRGQSILTLVNGMGGIGKSTLASFYANFPKYRAVYSHCFWVTVSDITGEIEDAIILAFLEALELDKITKKQQLQKIETYLSGLQGQTLLILDNANDDKKVKNSLTFLRKCKCKVLFTTRANVQHLKSLPLAKLLPEDAFTLFTHYFPAAKEMPETSQLLQNIDYHTLLTEFMAKSLAHNPVLSIQDLIEITQQQNFTDELLAYTQFTSYHTHTHAKPDAEIQPAKYLLQIFPIQNLSIYEKEILRHFSILPAEWLNMEMLIQLFVYNPYNIKNIKKGFIKFIRDFVLKLVKFIFPNTKKESLQLGITLQYLYEKGWLQKSPNNEFSCHILLQHIIRQQLKPNERNCKVLLENLYTVTCFDEYTNIFKLSDYLYLVDSALSWIKEDTKLIANIYNNSGAIYDAIGNYNQALNYHLKNVRIFEKKFGNDKINLATSYNNIARVYDSLENYQQALAYQLKSIHIQEKLITYDQVGLAISYGNIATIYNHLNDYKESIAYHLKSINIFKKVLSVKHPNLATAYNNIANTYDKLENYQQALTYHLEAINIKEKILVKEHPDLATSYYNIASTYYYLKGYKTAYSYIQKAVAIWTEVLPKGHPHIQNALNKKAAIEKAMQDE